MEYGSILAKQFDVPQRAQQGQLGGRGRGTAPAPAKDDFKLNEFLEKAPEGLERSSPDIAKQTAQYYQDWNELRSFAKTMWAKYKIDVQTPDPSNPDSIWANQAYNQKLGLLLDGVDNAKNSQKAWERRQTAVTEGKLLERQGYTPQGYSANNSVTEGYIPTAADPRIGVAKEEISGQFDTGVNQRNQMLGGMRSGLESTYGNDPERLAYQQALAQPLLASQNVKSDGNYGYGSGLGQVNSMATDVVKLLTGTHPNFEKTDIIDPTTKARVLVSRNNKMLNSGQYRVGGKPAVEMVYSGGNLYAVNEDWLKTKKLNSTNSLAFNPDSGYEIIQSVSNAAGLGKEVEQTLPYWKKLGFLEETGPGIYKSNPKALLSVDDKTAANQFNQEDQAEQIKIGGAVERVKKDVLTDFNAMLKGESVFDWVKRAMTPSPMFRGVKGIKGNTTEPPPTERIYSSGAIPGLKIVVTPTKQNGKRILEVSEQDDAGAAVKEPVYLADPQQAVDYVESRLGFNDLYIKTLGQNVSTPNDFVPDGFDAETWAILPEADKKAYLKAIGK